MVENDPQSEIVLIEVLAIGLPQNAVPSFLAFYLWTFQSIFIRTILPKWRDLVLIKSLGLIVVFLDSAALTIIFQRSIYSNLDILYGVVIGTDLDDWFICIYLLHAA